MFWLLDTRRAVRITAVTYPKSEGVSAPWQAFCASHLIALLLAPRQAAEVVLSYDDNHNDSP